LAGILIREFKCLPTIYLFRKALMPRTSLVVAMVADDTFRCQQCLFW